MTLNAEQMGQVYVDAAARVLAARTELNEQEVEAWGDEQALQADYDKRELNAYFETRMARAETAEEATLLEDLRLAMLTEAANYMMPETLDDAELDRLDVEEWYALAL